MNPMPDLAFWGNTFGWLAAGVGIVFALAWLLTKFMRSASIRREIWRAVMVGAALLCLAEIQGWTSLAAGWLQTKVPSEIVALPRESSVTPSPMPMIEMPAEPTPPAFEPESFVPMELLSQPAIASEPVEPDVSVTVEPVNVTPPVGSSVEPIAPVVPAWWPLFVWLGGIAVCLLRLLRSWFALALLRRKSQPVERDGSRQHLGVRALPRRFPYDGRVSEAGKLGNRNLTDVRGPNLRAERHEISSHSTTPESGAAAHALQDLAETEHLLKLVAVLADRIGLRRRIQVLFCPGLPTPIAFGWLRPTIGLPADFESRFTPTQREVMLAHELAHLATRDPFWQTVANGITAALWWHPFAWIARRELIRAAEEAADEVSAIVEDGPATLAVCLTRLGRELTTSPRGVVGMAGFRSGLGRRVERLLGMSAKDWQPVHRWRTAGRTLLATSLLSLIAALFTTACKSPQDTSVAEVVSKALMERRPPARPDEPKDVDLEIGAPGATTNASAIIVVGQVRLLGEPPDENSETNRALAKKYSFEMVPDSRRYDLAPDGGLSDVFVYVKHGLEGRSFPTPTQPMSIFLNDAGIKPQIVAVQTGQKVVYEYNGNSNITLLVTPQNGRGAFFSFGETMTQFSLSFDTPELFINHQVNPRGLLNPYVSVMNHPYFALTDARGHFQFPVGLPSGRYTIAAHHILAGDVTSEITIDEEAPTGRPMKVDFGLRPFPISQTAIRAQVVKLGFSSATVHYQDKIDRLESLIQKKSYDAVFSEFPDDSLDLLINEWKSVNLKLKQTNTKALVDDPDARAKFKERGEIERRMVKRAGEMKHSIKDKIAELKEKEAREHAEMRALTDLIRPSAIARKNPLKRVEREQTNGVPNSNAAPLTPIPPPERRPPARPDAAQSAGPQAGTPKAAIDLASATIGGRVRLIGNPPTERVVPESVMPPSMRGKKIVTRFFVRSADGGLGNVVVYVKHGLEGRTFSVPTNAVQLVITNGEFQPYVLGMQTGQRLEYVNQFEGPPSIIASPLNDRQLVLASFPGRLPPSRTFSNPELFIRHKTDVFPWMFAYVSVFDHPFFAVTDTNGQFHFPHPLPPGKYTIAAYHRKAGEVIRDVVVDATGAIQGATTLDFELHVPTSPQGPVAASRSAPVPASSARPPAPRPAVNEKPALPISRVEGRNNILHHLETLMIPTVNFDGLPLPEVMRLLDTAIREAAPGKRAVPMFLNPRVKPFTKKGAQDLDVVIIDVADRATPLQNLSALDALDVIVKGADSPIGFVVTDSGVSFRFRDPAKPFVLPRLNTKPDNTALRAKLEKIILPEVVYNGLPLTEVLKIIRDDALRFDAEREGVNFLITPYFPDPPPGARQRSMLKDVNGNPLPPPPGAGPFFAIELDTVIVTIKPPLKNVRLIDALDAIVKSADRPIQWRMTDYSVLFTPDYDKVKQPPVAQPKHDALLYPTNPPRAVGSPQLSDRLEALHEMRSLLEQEIARGEKVYLPRHPRMDSLRRRLGEIKGQIESLTDEQNAIIRQAKEALRAKTTGPASQTEKGRTKTPSDIQAEKSPYIIARGDEVFIKVWKRDDLGTRVIVQPDGGVLVPVAGQVSVEGMSLLEARDAIVRAFERAGVEGLKMVLTVTEHRLMQSEAGNNGFMELDVLDDSRTGKFLDSIIVPELGFDDTPLINVLTYLMKVVNSARSGDPSTPIGLSVYALSGHPITRLESVRVTVKPTLKNVPFRKAILAVQASADIRINIRLGDRAIFARPEYISSPMGRHPVRFFMGTVQLVRLAELLGITTLPRMNPHQMLRDYLVASGITNFTAARRYPPGPDEFFYDSSVNQLFFVLDRKDEVPLSKAIRRLNSKYPLRVKIETRLFMITNAPALAAGGISDLPPSGTNRFPSPNKGGFTGRPSPTTNGIPGPVQAVLTAPQYRMIVRASEQKYGVSGIDGPTKTIRPGRRSSIHFGMAMLKELGVEPVDLRLTGPIRLKVQIVSGDGNAPVPPVSKLWDITLNDDDTAMLAVPMTPQPPIVSQPVPAHRLAVDSLMIFLKASRVDSNGDPFPPSPTKALNHTF